MVASAFLVGAVPAHAASTLSGSFVEPAAGSGDYASSSKLDCPTTASSIFDCTLYGELTGPKYKAMYPAPVAPNTPAPAPVAAGPIPLGITALIDVTYYAAINYSGQISDYQFLSVYAPVLLDQTTGKIFFIKKLSDFYFSDWSANPSASWNFTEAGNITKYSPLGSSCPTAGSDPLNPSLNGTHQDGQEFADAPLMSPVICRVYGKRTAPMYDWRSSQVPFTADVAASRARSLAVQLVKTPLVTSPKVSDGVIPYLLGSELSSATAIGLKGGGFAPVLDPNDPRSNSCGTSPDFWRTANSGQYGFAQASQAVGPQDFPYPAGAELDQKASSASASVMLGWVNYDLNPAQCYAANTSRYSSQSTSSWISSDSHTISDSELSQLVAGWKPYNPAPGSASTLDVPRPDFATCIDINPLSFRWDWPCVFQSLFIASPTSMSSMTKSNQVLLTRFPFNYLPMMFDFTNEIFNSAAVCTPLSVSVGVLTVPLIPCDVAVRDVVKPMTTWIFSLFIAFQVGSWVLRKFLPGTPGEK